MPLVCQAIPIGAKRSRLPSHPNFVASNLDEACSCGEPMNGTNALCDAGIPKAVPSRGATLNR